MFHRSCKLLNFIQHNLNGSCRKQFHIFHKGLIKRHTSTFIKQKFIHVIFNSSKLYHNQHVGTRWTWTTILRYASSDVKGKSEKKVEIIENEQEKNAKVENIQRIIELNETLGKLKERILNIESEISPEENTESKVKLLKKDKTKKDEKKIVIDETLIKKCKYSILFYRLFMFFYIYFYFK